MVFGSMAYGQNMTKERHMHESNGTLNAFSVGDLCHEKSRSILNRVVSWMVVKDTEIVSKRIVVIRIIQAESILPMTVQFS